MHPSDTTTLGVHIRRIYSEYLEMPGLRLTFAQAQRLWGLDAEVCTHAMRALVEGGFLRKTDGGQYVRVSDGPAAIPTRRMAKAALTDRGVAVKSSRVR